MIFRELNKLFYTYFLDNNHFKLTMNCGVSTPDSHYLFIEKQYLWALKSEETY